MMDADHIESDSSSKNDDNMRVPITHLQHDIPPSWWSFEYYEIVFKKRLGFNRLLTPNEVLVVRVVLSLAFFAVALIYYSSVENWNFSKCCYFMAVSLSGIGYGHVVPTTAGSRIFTCFFLVVGIVLVTTTMSALVSRYILPAQNNIVDYFFPSLNKHEQTRKHELGSILFILFVLFLGTLVFTLTEDWGINSTFYFVIVTMTTVGYGDFYTTTPGNQSFLVFFIILCSISYMGALENFGFYLLVTDPNSPRNINASANARISKNWNVGKDGRLFFKTESVDNIDHACTSASPLHEIGSTSSPSHTMNDLTYDIHEYQYIISTLIKNKVLDKERDLDTLLSTYRTQQYNHTNYDSHDDEETIEITL